MGAVVLGNNANANTPNSARTTPSFTPVANDLLIAFATVAGQAAGGTFSDTQGLGWTQIDTALYHVSADVLVFAVANGLCVGAPMTVTFTPAGAPTDTGLVFTVMRVSGMNRVGAAAVRQSAKVQNQTSSANPAATFGSAVLTGNPTVGAVGSFGGTNTPPTGWTELSDIIGSSSGIPAIETVSRDSGFTGTVVTWGALVNTFSVLIAELEASPFASVFIENVYPATMWEKVLIEPYF